ncbi:MAG TPA: hypothetical protein VGF55_04300, partial [Gemmataceae bacterium]
VVVAVAGVWMVVHFSKAGRGDPRLIGAWRSDADATFAELRKSRPVTDEQEQKLRTVFGHLKVTYTDTIFTTDFDGAVASQPYQVISKDATSVVIETKSPLSGQDEPVRIRFIGNDMYWVEFEGAGECFRRVN